jgi:methionyl aminopeptidase
MIIIKTQHDIEQIKIAAEIWKKVKKRAESLIRPGITTLALDEEIGKAITSYDAVPTFLGYNGFKRNVCISVNEQLIHGVANNYIIKPSDKITVDIGVTYNNYIVDAAFTKILEPVKLEDEKINKITLKALMESIKVIKPGIKTGLISNTIQKVVEGAGYHIIKDFSGHGCGIQLHEDPQIPNYGDVEDGTVLKQNMIICIEPMVMQDSDDYEIDKIDKWTVRAKNKKTTCHWEHMVLVTEKGFEVLTE